MQIATVVAGGKVGQSKNGLEFGISKPIEITEIGAKSTYMSHRKSSYAALCIHFDEVIKTPKNALVLASNSHSLVQAMSFNYKKGSFFGVQYHPEFKTSDMALIASFLAKKLIRSGAFNTLEDLENFTLSLKTQKGIPDYISNYQLHNQEVMAWLKEVSSKL